MVFEDAVHGSEIINGNPRHDNYNERALEMCRRHPEFYRLAGSDTHRNGDEARGGVILPHRVQDSFAYKAMIEARDFQLWSPEEPELVAADVKLREENGK